MLAPLAVPVIFSTTATLLSGSNDPFAAFLIMLTASCFVSYGATIFLFLPSLFLLSLDRQMTGLKVSLLGLVLGTFVFVSFTFIAWASIDPATVAPVSFSRFLRWATGPISALFPLAGLVMAALYWWLGSRRPANRSPRSDALVDHLPSSLASLSVSRRLDRAIKYSEADRLEPRSRGVPDGGQAVA
jgi:hypothetical protein